MSLQDLIFEINHRDLLIKKLEEDIQKDQTTLIELQAHDPRNDVTIEWHQRNITDSKTTIQGHKHVVAEILLEHVLAFLRNKELN